MKGYVWPYMQRKENCMCELCQEWRKQQEIERCIRVVNNWGSVKNTPVGMAA